MEYGILRSILDPRYRKHKGKWPSRGNVLGGVESSDRPSDTGAEKIRPSNMMEMVS